MCAFLMQRHALAGANLTKLKVFKTDFYQD